MKDNLILEFDTINSFLNKKGEMFLATHSKSDNTTSIFQNHQLIPHYDKEHEIRPLKYDLVAFSLFLILFIFFARLYAYRKKTLANTIIEFFRFTSNQNSLSDDKAVQKRIQLLLFIFFLTTITFLIKSILNYYNIRLLNIYFPDEIIIALIVAALFFLKVFIIWLIGVILNYKKETQRYISQSFSFVYSLGLFLLPIMILLLFMKPVPYTFFTIIGTTIVLFFWIIRNIKGIILGLNNSKFSKIYLFIYLCTLEILPLLIITKTLINVFS